MISNHYIEEYIFLKIMVLKQRKRKLWSINRIHRIYQFNWTQHNFVNNHKNPTIINPKSLPQAHISIGEKMATGLRLATERTGDGAGQPILDADDGEELVHVQPGVSIVLGNRPPESPGTLYISTKYIIIASFSFPLIWVYFLNWFVINVFSFLLKASGVVERHGQGERLRSRFLVGVTSRSVEGPRRLLFSLHLYSGEEKFSPLLQAGGALIFFFCLRLRVLISVGF